MAKNAGRLEHNVGTREEYDTARAELLKRGSTPRRARSRWPSYSTAARSC